jgi:hypothetical protein
MAENEPKLDLEEQRKREEEQKRQERAQKQGRDQVLESGRQGRHGSIAKE